jgi:hypothetical protein
LNHTDASVVERDNLGDLLTALSRRGYEVVGPTVRDGAIVYDRLTSSGDLPIGWTDVQDGGSYRLVRRDDAACFGYAVGPHSWKRYLFPPDLLLWRAKRTNDLGDFDLDATPEEPPRYAFVGVRPCDLHAIAVQDRVFMGTAVTRPGPASASRCGRGRGRAAGSISR